MNVMNIKHYLSAVAALSMLAACSDYDPGTSGNAIDLTDAEIKTIEEYTANFVNRYGEMDPNHTWGFGVKGSEDEMGTRAVQTERNNWAIVENGEIVTQIGTYHKTNDPWNSPMDYETKKNWVIPGLPSNDGLYYLGRDNELPEGYTEEQALAILSTPGNQLIPNGDVTDEEIEYVSWWFRTNPNPTTTTPPFTEYFVQDISQDFDRESYPNGEWKDMNSDKTKRIVPVVYHNTEGSNTDSEAMGYGMDYFSVLTSDGSWEHNNNFNKGKANPIAEAVPQTNYPDTTALKTSTTTYPNRTLKYWTSEGPYQNAKGSESDPPIYKDGAGYTTSFSFHNSDDNTDYEHYKLVHLQFYGPRTGKWYDGYYLGFDYEVHKSTDLGGGAYKTTDINRDNYYSNWIVKISPANPDWYKDDHIWHRVMCEDLGSTNDYDFNDLVFDVYYTGTGTDADPYIAHIRIQASGGTLPIHIGYDEDSYETHRLLQGDDVEYNASTNLYSPINVGFSSVRGPVTADPVDIVLNMTELAKDKSKATDPDYIPIYVNKFTSDERKAFVLPITSRTDAAPQKICIDGKKQPNANKVRWMKERMQIEDTYTNFSKWVNVKNSPYDYGEENDWTQTGLQNTGNLY